MGGSADMEGMKAPRALRLGPALALARTEWKGFWSGPAGGLAAAVFLVLAGLWTYNSVASYASANLDAMGRGRALDSTLALFSGSLEQLGLILMLVTPLATMRSYADFAGGGHLDMTLALPLSRAEITLAHFLAAAGSVYLLVLLSLPPFAALIMLGTGSAELLACGALGLLLLTLAFTATGLAVASAASSPAASALLTLGVLGVFWAAGWAAPYLPAKAAYLAQGLAFAPRLSHFAAGVVDLNDACYFLVLAAAGLWLARPFQEK
jgi:ABC-2 type transport system permease protein